MCIVTLKQYKNELMRLQSLYSSVETEGQLEIIPFAVAETANIQPLVDSHRWGIKYLPPHPPPKKKSVRHCL